MVRFVLGQEKELLRDDFGHRAGRGAYACKVATCIETIMDRGRLERVFRRPRRQRPETGCLQNDGVVGVRNP
jgi:predicted RNA-binding protein YlxR (DUF448 family)